MAHFTVLGKTLCDALLAPACEGRPGAEAALVSRGTTVPLSPTNNAFPQWLGTSNANTLSLETHTSVFARKYTPTHLLSLYGRPLAMMIRSGQGGQEHEIDGGEGVMILTSGWGGGGCFFFLEGGRGGLFLLSGGWGGGVGMMPWCVLVRSSGANWPIATYCPSLGPFPSVGGGAHRPLTTLCPSSPLAYLSLSTSLPFPLCANGTPGLSLFHCSVSGGGGGGW